MNPSITAALLCVMATGLAASTAVAQEKNAMHTSVLSGQQWMEELLDGHDGRFYDAFGMRKHVFWCLIDVLHRNASLGDTKHVSLEEQLGIFLYTAVTGCSNRKVQERFQRSGDTISKCFHRILNALVSPEVYNAYVHLPSNTTPLAKEIADSSDFYPFLKGCLGAIDGTHIHAYVPELDRPRYRNRKGDISQNVLAVCSMDMRFLYVLPGWEGSASDSRVFENARSTDFNVPEGKYYLADAGFPSCNALLVPYRNVRYHLREWGLCQQLPRNPKELFNLRHASAWNIIERIFGVMKKRYKILIMAPEYPIGTQARLVCALAVTHNLIRIHDPEDLPEPLEAAHDEDRDEGRLQDGVPAAERPQAEARRDKIAKDMWANRVRRRR